MTWVAAAVTAGTTIVGGYLKAGAAKEAAEQQQRAAAAAQAEQRANFDRISQQEAGYRATGYGALNNIGSMSTGQYQTYDAQGNPTGTKDGSGYFQHQFNADDLKAGLAPNYDFQLQQGQQAANAAANVGGGLIGGNALQGLQNTTQSIAGNAYQKAFENYQSQRTGIYNTLAGIAGIGRLGQNATNEAGTNMANAVSGLGMSSGRAGASGTLGEAQSYADTLKGVGGAYSVGSYLASKGDAVTGV